MGPNLKYDKSWFMKKKKKLKGSLVRTFWHLDNWWDVLWAAFCNSHDVWGKIYKFGGRSFKKLTSTLFIDFYCKTDKYLHDLVCFCDLTQCLMLSAHFTKENFGCYPP